MSLYFGKKKNKNLMKWQNLQMSCGNFSTFCTFISKLCCLKAFILKIGFCETSYPQLLEAHLLCNPS